MRKNAKSKTDRAAGTKTSNYVISVELLCVEYRSTALPIQGDRINVVVARDVISGTSCGEGSG